MTFTHLRRMGVALALALGAAAWMGAADPPRMPEFRHGVAEAWLHSKPLSGADLRGKVVLIELFTTG